MNQPVENILVIRFSSIGDIVLTTPILRALKITYPNMNISYLVKPGFASMVKDHPLIDEVLYYESHEAAVQLLKERNFDWVVDLQKNTRTKRLYWALSWDDYSSFPKLNVLKWLQVNFKWNVLPKHKSIVERYFEALEPLGISYMPELGLEFFVDDKWEVKTEDIPLSHSAGYVLAVIGGTKSTKRYPTEHWIAFVKQISFPVVVIGGKEDIAVAIQIKDAEPGKVYNSIGKFSIQESALLTKHAKVVVANDTGFMHIAAAYKRPIVSLWGNTIPEFGMYPYYPSDKQYRQVRLEVNNLSCRPCSKIGYDECPKKHFKCMKHISPQRVVEAVKKLWKDV